MPLDTNTGGSNYLLGGLPLNTNTDGSNSDLLGGLSLDPDDQSLFTDTGIDDTSSMFAASNTDCSVDSSLLPGGLISRSDSCAATGSGGDNTGGGAAINIDKKVTPFLNLETMELNEICPQSPINPNRIAVCSSPRRKGDTKQWPYAPFHWILTNGELSKRAFFKKIASLRVFWNANNELIKFPLSVTVDVLLRCLAPKRFIFCCREFNQDFIQPPPMYRTEGVLVWYPSNLTKEHSSILTQN